jgi:hypothetical protein
MRRALLVIALAVALSAPSTAAGQSATPGCSPAPVDCSGWYAVDVRLSWEVHADYSEDCNNERFTDDGVRQRTCFVRNSPDVGWTSIPVTVRIDKTAPRVERAAASRGPDANGWYRSPLAVSFFGTDHVPGVDSSGVAGCDTATYAGPDAAAAQVLGRCWDVAGNVSAPSAFSLSYDTTAPSIAKLDADPGDRVVDLTWEVRDAMEVKVLRSANGSRLLDTRADASLHDRGLRNGRRYGYRIEAVDQAGNVATRAVSVVPGPRLLTPANGVTLDGPPLLRWTPVQHAAYYNVQLFRRGRKVLSAWPARPRLRLEGAWQYGGRRYTLRPAKYTWLVWPGRGARSRNDYGPLIGRGTFTVADS